jgi:hypothetical protein
MMGPEIPIVVSDGIERGQVLGNESEIDSLR